MKKNKKLILIILFAILIITISISSFYYYKMYLPGTKEFSIKIYQENGYFLDEIKINNSNYIQLLNNQDKLAEKIEIKNNEITVNKSDNGIIYHSNIVDNTIIIKLTDLENKDKFFETWLIEKSTQEFDEFYKKDIIFYTIKPNYRKKEKDEVLLTFTTDSNATILEDEQKVDYYKAVIKIKENVLDQIENITIKVNKDYKGDWYLNKKKVDESTKINKDSEIVFKTYQDKNNNKIDDLTEKFTVQFNTDLADFKIKNKIVKFDETIHLPNLNDEKNDRIFYDWYLDNEFKKKFTNQTKIRENIILYAKFLNFKDVINSSVENPYYRKDIALQVKNILDKRNKVLDDNYNKIIQKEDKERKELEEFRRQNNIVVREKKKVIKLHNTNQNKLFLITFINKENEYIFSFVAPYGQTIKVLNQNGNLFKEYSARQDTSVILDDDKLLFKGSNSTEYFAEYRKINETVFIVIQPKLN